VFGVACAFSLCGHGDVAKVMYRFRWRGTARTPRQEVLAGLWPGLVGAGELLAYFTLGREVWMLVAAIGLLGVCVLQMVTAAAKHRLSKQPSGREGRAWHRVLVVIGASARGAR
jgi:hypothetical protein